MRRVGEAGAASKAVAGGGLRAKSPVGGGGVAGGGDGTLTYWHFPSHDIPGAAQVKRMGDDGWKWLDAPDATAVAGSRLSVLHRSEMQGVLYPSTKSLAAADRSIALDGITLFKDMKLGKSREQLLTRRRERSTDEPTSLLVVLLQHTYFRYTIVPLMLLGFLLPVMRELYHKDLDQQDFAFLWSVQCTLFYIRVYDVCSPWPAFFYLSVLFLIAVPFVLINHQYVCLATQSYCRISCQPFPFYSFYLPPRPADIATFSPKFCRPKLTHLENGFLVSNSASTIATSPPSRSKSPWPYTRTPRTSPLLSARKRMTLESRLFIFTRSNRFLQARLRRQRCRRRSSSIRIFGLKSIKKPSILPPCPLQIFPPFFPRVLTCVLAGRGGLLGRARCSSASALAWFCSKAFSLKKCIVSCTPVTCCAARAPCRGIPPES